MSTPETVQVKVAEIVEHAELLDDLLAAAYESNRELAEARSQLELAMVWGAEMLRAAYLAGATEMRERAASEIELWDSACARDIRALPLESEGER
jgi:hypothetical protein